jgi:hypothetical protein
MLSCTMGLGLLLAPTAEWTEKNERMGAGPLLDMQQECSKYQIMNWLCL